METTNDIFNEMRNWDYHSDLDLNAHEVLSQYADRFWEAHRREVEQYLNSLVKCDKEIARLKAALNPVLEFNPSGLWASAETMLYKAFASVQESHKIYNGGE